MTVMEAQDDKPSGARCLDCDYPLRGLPENRCPECGRGFDPDDPKTMRSGYAIGPTVRLWLKPPDRVFHFFVGFNALLMLLSVGLPEVCFPLLLISLGFWLIIGGAWSLRLLGSIGVAWYLRQPTFKCWKTWRRWSLTPVILACTISLLYLDAPFWLAFHVSRPAMDRLARQVMASPSDPPRGAWVGLYNADAIEAFPGGMRFIVSGAGSFTRAGFAWSPGGAPPVTDDRYRHVEGPWYIWIEDW